MTLNDARRIAAALCLLSLAACDSLRRPPEHRMPGQDATATPIRDDLPAELKLLEAQGLAVRGERVTFEGELNFPPRLVGQPTDSTVTLAVATGPHPSMREARVSLRAAALANPRVTAAIGARFSLLRSGWLEAGKEAEANAAADRYELVFYNYAKNEVATVITSRQGELVDVQTSPARVQPAESREEVDAAVGIVQGDDRYAGAVKGLLGRGIQTPGPGRDRYLFLMFYREPRTPALFEATVNMSTGKVVAARSLR